MNAKTEIKQSLLEGYLMNKMSIVIWGRKFELDVVYKTFSNKGATELQCEAADKFCEKEEFNDSLEQIKGYVLDNGGSENGVKEIENIFKYVMPKSIYVPKASERIVAILCDYRFDPEHGIAIVYKNETFGYIDEEGAVI